MGPPREAGLVGGDHQSLGARDEEAGGQGREDGPDQENAACTGLARVGWVSRQNRRRRGGAGVAARDDEPVGKGAGLQDGHGL